MALTRTPTDMIIDRVSGEKLSSTLAQSATKGLDIPVNIKDYGATGDGVTDDTTFIQNALNASTNVFIPLGDYKVTSKLIMQPFTKLTLAGNPTRFNDGIAKVARLKITTNTPLIEMFDGCSIVGGRLEVSYTGYSQAVVLIDYSTQFRRDLLIDTSIRGFDYANSIAVLLTGNGNGGQSEQVKVRGQISSFDIGVKADYLGGTCWATRLNVDATIVNCNQAIVCLNGAGGAGGYFAGSYQPKSTTGNPAITRALIELRNVDQPYIIAKIWDMSTAVNNYAIALYNCKNSYYPPMLSSQYILNNTIRSTVVKNPVIVPRGKTTYFDTMSGNEENILFGADSKYVVTFTNSADVGITGSNASYEKMGMFKLQQKPTYMILNTTSPNATEWVGVQIDFDVPKTITMFGFNPKSEPVPRPKSYRLYKKSSTDPDFVLLKEANTADEIASSGGVPETSLFTTLNPDTTAKDIVSLKYEFLLEKNNYATIDSMWAKGSGQAESYLPCYGGQLFGTLEMKKGGIVLNPISTTGLANNTIFIDLTDGKLKFKDNTGTVKTVTLA